MILRTTILRTTILRKTVLLLGALLWTGLQASAQQTPSPDASATSAAAANQREGAALLPVSADTTPGTPGHGDYYRKVGKKMEYFGPATIVELAPTPMLDEEGKQRLDPDGKPMFNPAVKQQRDKRGHPLFDESGKPVMQTASELGYDEHGKKLHVKKVKPPKMIPVSISRGTLTVDGMTGKAALNYDIADFKYMYIFAPGIGIAVVSNEPFPGATEQKKAFDNNTLTVNIGDHVLQLASENRLLGKKVEPAYVLLDRNFVLPSEFPVIGYGPTRKAPYSWPGAKPNRRETDALNAPPPPADLMPVQLLKPCPTGQMRMPGPAVLPGQVAPVQPCVPIVKAISAGKDHAAAKPQAAKTQAAIPGTGTAPAANR